MRSDAHVEIARREKAVLAALRIPCESRGHIPCPFPDHEDRHPSWRWDSAKARWYCTCGSGSIFDAVMRMHGCTFREAKDFALGKIEMRAAQQPKAERAREVVLQQPHEIAKTLPRKAELRHKAYGLPVAFWPYAASDGSGIFGVTARYEGKAVKADTERDKAVLPWMWTGKAWICKRVPGLWPPFRATSFLANPDAHVLWVEGEKSVCGAEQLPMFEDYVVSTSMGGTGQHRGTDYSLLKARPVLIWPDNDAAGRTYAEDIAKHASKAGAASVHIVDIPEGWPAKWDLADPMDDLPDSIDLDDIISDARLWSHG